VWTKHGEIDDTLHEVDTGVGDNNSDGVFDGDDPDTTDDDDFDYQELLRHVESQVLSSMGTKRGLSNMGILEKSSKDLLYNESAQLHVMLEILKLKVCHGWSDNSSSKLLSLLEKLLPKQDYYRS
jgi:hypothetical protein